MVASVLVKFKLKEGAILPLRALDGDSGRDLFSNKEVTLQPNERKKIPTGVSVELPKGWEYQVRPKSGMSLSGLDTKLGTIDSNYRGEISVIIQNSTKEPLTIKRGQKCGQLVLQRVEVDEEIEVVEELSESNRGEGGFGHTGEF